MPTQTTGATQLRSNKISNVRQSKDVFTLVSACGVKQTPEKLTKKKETQTNHKPKKNSDNKRVMDMMAHFFDKFQNKLVIRQSGWIFSFFIPGI